MFPVHAHPLRKISRTFVTNHLQDAGILPDPPPRRYGYTLNPAAELLSMMIPGSAPDQVTGLEYHCPDTIILTLAPITATVAQRYEGHWIVVDADEDDVAVLSREAAQQWIAAAAGAPATLPTHMMIGTAVNPVPDAVPDAPPLVLSPHDPDQIVPTGKRLRALPTLLYGNHIPDHVRVVGIYLDSSDVPVYIDSATMTPKPITAPDVRNHMLLPFLEEAMSTVAGGYGIVVDLQSSEVYVANRATLYSVVVDQSIPRDQRPILEFILPHAHPIVRNLASLGNSYARHPDTFWRLIAFLAFFGVAFIGYIVLRMYVMLGVEPGYEVLTWIPVVQYMDDVIVPLGFGYIGPTVSLALLVAWLPTLIQIFGGAFGAIKEVAYTWAGSIVVDICLCGVWWIAMTLFRPVVCAAEGLPGVGGTVPYAWCLWGYYPAAGSIWLGDTLTFGGDMAITIGSGLGWVFGAVLVLLIVVVWCLLGLALGALFAIALEALGVSCAILLISLSPALPWGLRAILIGFGKGVLILPRGIRDMWREVQPPRKKHHIIHARSDTVAAATTTQGQPTPIRVVEYTPGGADDPVYQQQGGSL